MANIYCIKYLATSAKKFDYIIQLVQPKEFETDPEFLQLCQNLTTDFFVDLQTIVTCLKFF